MENRQLPVMAEIYHYCSHRLDCFQNYQDETDCPYLDICGGDWEDLEDFSSRLKNRHSELKEWN